MDKANYSFFVTFVQADLQPTNEARAKQIHLLCLARRRKSVAQPTNEARAKQSHLFCLARRRKSVAQPTNEARAEQNLFELCLARRKAEGQYDCTEKGNCNPQLKDRANGEGLQIPLFNAAGLQIRPNGFFRNYSDKGIMLWAKRRR
ncbi:MAG: hypothetical protein IKP91_08225 [Bacteroidaceae bacterium]|nr:hypothetical protein [Bacteroidaceae bacterium]